MPYVRDSTERPRWWAFVWRRLRGSNADRVGTARPGFLLVVFREQCASFRALAPGDLGNGTAGRSFGNASAWLKMARHSRATTVTKRRNQIPASRAPETSDDAVMAMEMNWRWHCLLLFFDSHWWTALLVHVRVIAFFNYSGDGLISSIGWILNLSWVLKHCVLRKQQ